MNPWEPFALMSRIRGLVGGDEYISLHDMQQMVSVGGPLVWDYLKGHKEARELIHPESADWSPGWVPGFKENYGYIPPHSMSSILSQLELAARCERLLRGEEDRHIPFNRSERQKWKSILAPFRSRKLYVVERGLFGSDPSGFLSPLVDGDEPNVVLCGGMGVVCVQTRMYYSDRLFMGVQSESMHPFHVKRFPLHSQPHELLIFAAPPRLEFA